MLTLLGEPVWVGAFGWEGGPLTGVTVEGGYKHTKKTCILQVQMCGESAKELHLHSVAYQHIVYMYHAWA